MVVYGSTVKVCFLAASAGLCASEDAVALVQMGVVRSHQPPPAAPKEPGCYVWMPSGCPGLLDARGKDWKEFAENANISSWNRDQVGESNSRAGWLREVCEEKRRTKFNSMCGTTDATMLFISGKAPEAPKEPGCYVWLPDGCPKNPFKENKHWRRTHEDSNETVCLETAKARYDEFCGVNNTLFQFVADMPKAPQAAGCYVWMPSGCSKHSSISKLDWKRDTWGQSNAGATGNRASCESRKAGWDSWCGETDAKMLFVEGVVQKVVKHLTGKTKESTSVELRAGTPKAPEEAGCFVFLPSGCEKEGIYKMNQWKRDSSGQQNGGAGINETKCQVDRKKHWMSSCEHEDVTMLFVSHSKLLAATATPAEPGCYVWIPTGCKDQAFHTRKTWKRDRWGEEHLSAGFNKELCERKRKKSFDAWCGNHNAKFLFVAPWEHPELATTKHAQKHAQLASPSAQQSTSKGDVEYLD